MRLLLILIFFANCFAAGAYVQKENFVIAAVFVGCAIISRDTLKRLD